MMVVVWKLLFGFCFSGLSIRAFTNSWNHVHHAIFQKRSLGTSPTKTTNFSPLLLLRDPPGRSTRRRIAFARLNVASQSDNAGGTVSDAVPNPSQRILDRMQQLQSESMEYAMSFGLSEFTDGAFHALFRAIREEDLVRQKIPFVLRYEQVQTALFNAADDRESSSAAVVEWPGFFSMTHLAKALEDDFLDAARGSTDNRKGWQITEVSVPRGESFQEARMTYEDVLAALEKGTVIFNAAGAHIPALAGPSLACTDATALPCALNLYITAAGQRTSAPPHTDKQDVVVIQSTGCKHWKVYAPPNPAEKPLAESFARGKMEDSLPLYLLETDLGCALLLETTLFPGDVLFIPAAFPHTTSTVLPVGAGGVMTHHKAAEYEKDTSIHLTMGLDHHIWDLDFLSVRRLALRRAGVADTGLGRIRDEENPYTGACNQLPPDVHQSLFAVLPLGFLEEDDAEVVVGDQMVEEITKEVERISVAVDEATARQIPASVWREAVERIRQHGRELLEIHRNMYLAALEEGRIREAEEAMTAHLHGGEDGDATNHTISSSRKNKKVVMTPERVQRLSLFRVKRFFDEIDQTKKRLLEWSWQVRHTAASETRPSIGDGSSMAGRNESVAPTTIKVGDRVEADLGGAFFPATVTRLSADGARFDVQFFDGDRETGLTRSQIKPYASVAAEPVPAASALPGEDLDTIPLTAKQLKRLRKQQKAKA